MSFIWDNPFKAEDFERWTMVHPAQNMAGVAAQLANARFRELIKEHGKRVYRNGKWESNPWHEGQQRFLEAGDHIEDTHTGIIICEKEIKGINET